MSYRPSIRAAIPAVLLLAGLAVGCGAPDGDGGPAAASGGEGAAPSRGPGAAKGKGKGMGGWAGPGSGGAAEPAVPVIVGTVAIDDMEAFLDASSTFEAEAAVEVVSQATGIVAELGAEEGDRIAKGGLLARLAYEDLELAEQRARSEFERLENDYARATQLKAENFISEEEFQKIRFDRVRAEIDWKTARLNLDRTRIAAPIGGTVTSRKINVGQLIRENEPVYDIVDFDSLIAPVFVPEKYLPDLHVGQAAVVTPRGAGGAPVAGRVRRIAPVIDSQSGTVRVVVDLPGGRALRPGMFADVQIVLDAHENVVVVPKKALVYEDERPHVFVLEGDTAVRRALELGYQDGARAEVVAGLSRGDRVVLVGQSTLKDGSRVVAEDEAGVPVDLGGPADATAAADGRTPPAGASAGS